MWRCGWKHTLKTVAVVTAEEQVRTLFCTAHLPLLETRVKPVPIAKLVDAGRMEGGRMMEDVPDGVAVKVAHVPVVYQVPPLMMQPF